jgi:hypothetical protein
MTSLVAPEGLEEAGREQLPEECVCLAIVDNAESWLARTKRIMQGNSFTSSEISKGTPLQLIQDLFREGCSIPLNLEYEMRPLKTALRDTATWLAEYGDMLHSLGIRSRSLENGSFEGSRSSNISINSSSSSSSSGDAAGNLHSCTGPGGEGNELVELPTSDSADDLVSLEDLVQCVAAAAILSSDFHEVR